MSNIKAVIFDLDDTLFPESDYVKSGFCAVGKEVEKKFGIANAGRIMFDFFLKDKTDVYGRVLREYGKDFTQADIDKLAEIYRNHSPQLTLHEDVKDALSALKMSGHKLGILTDGRPFGQHAKINALGLKKLVDEIIITDELGGEEFRKPNPAAFIKMCELLNVSPEEMVYIGDNPKKDFVIKKYLPIKTVRLLSDGIYRNGDYAYDIFPDATVSNLNEVETILEKL